VQSSSTLTETLAVDWAVCDEPLPFTDVFVYRPVISEVETKRVLELLLFDFSEAVMTLNQLPLLFVAQLSPPRVVMLVVEPHTTPLVYMAAPPCGLVVV